MVSDTFFIYLCLWCSAPRYVSECRTETESFRGPVTPLTQSTVRSSIPVDLDLGRPVRLTPFTFLRPVPFIVVERMALGRGWWTTKLRLGSFR